MIEGLPSQPLGQGFVLRTFDGPFIIVPEQLYIGTLSNSNATLYTAPATNTQANELALTPRVKIREILACNLTGAAHTLTLYLVESGGSAADNRKIFNAYSVAANSTAGFTLNTMIPQGATIQGFADAINSLTLTISGELHYAP